MTNCWPTFFFAVPWSYIGCIWAMYGPWGNLQSGGASGLNLFIDARDAGTGGRVGRWVGVARIDEKIGGASDLHFSTIHGPYMNHLFL